MIEKTYRKALNEALTQAMRANDKVYLIGEDIGVYGGGFGVTHGLLEEFGSERVRETPISESAIAGVCVGSAMMGMRPIMELHFSDFITIAMDQIVNQAAKMHYMNNGNVTVPMVIRAPFGIGTGAGAQHSQSLESWFTHIPGLVVIEPSNAYDAKGLLFSAIKDENPVVFFEHKMLYEKAMEVPDEKYLLPIGVADIKRVGSDVTIIATAQMVNYSLLAAKRLALQGISVEVVDPRTLVPLDKKTLINSVSKTGRVLIVTEEVKVSGFGAEITAMLAESLAFNSLKTSIKRIGAAFTPTPVAEILEKTSIPQILDIVLAVEQLMKDTKYLTRKRYFTRAF
ncbi:MAG: alpha-ketoacid dehydrogenase subunit beta [Streptococcaceae bacterium]|nr:alpha-ketoacid dehydrogenase subunit beta [Streptococcaceae bacterium]